LSQNVRRALAPTAFLLVAFMASSGEAFTLQRLVGSVDLSKLASASQIERHAFPSEAMTIAPVRAEVANASTEFQFNIPADMDVVVEVIDGTGNCVCSARMHMPAGLQKVGFGGRDARGRELPNGDYQYVVTAGDIVRTVHVTIAR
jgi:FlgD Ig-like domain